MIACIGQLTAYEGIGSTDWDIRDHLKIYMGANCERPLKQAAEEYVALNYPKAYTKAYSLPEDFILSSQKFNELCKKARKDDIDMDLPLDQYSVAIVFDQLKNALKDTPSLTVFDYAFTDTMLKGINKEKKKKLIQDFNVPEEFLPSGDHDVFGFGISGREIIGIFFQIKAITSKTAKKTTSARFIEAAEQIEKDFKVFRTMCSKFLSPIVKIAGFVAFPAISKSDLLKSIKCRECQKRILTMDDLHDQESFKGFLERYGIKLEKPYGMERDSSVMKTFKDIFDLYVCAASAVDIPRNITQFHEKNKKHMRPMLVILTPQQKALVQEKSKIVFFCGGSGTGKTFVLKKRAQNLAKDKGEVLLINLAGGLLTEEFRCDFKGETDCSRSNLTKKYSIWWHDT